MRRRLTIDWDELESALAWRLEEGGHYLDVTSGDVVSFTGLDDELSEGEIDSGLAEGRLIPIEPLDSSVEYSWMAAFAESVADGQLARLLEVALSGRGAFRRFKDVLGDYPAERKRWFTFRDERVKGVVLEWLEEHDIQPANESRRPGDPPREF